MIKLQFIGLPFTYCHISMVCSTCSRDKNRPKANNRIAQLQPSAVNPYMRYGCGAEATAATAKKREHRKYECLIPFMLRNSMRWSCGFFPPVPWSDSCHCPQGSGKWAWFALPPIFLFKFLDSYQQLPNFPKAGNLDEGQLRKTELKLYAVVIGTVFRSLQPKACWHQLDSHTSFIACWTAHRLLLPLPHRWYRLVAEKKSSRVLRRLQVLSSKASRKVYL